MGQLGNSRWIESPRKGREGQEKLLHLSLMSSPAHLALAQQVHCLGNLAEVVHSVSWDEELGTLMVRPRDVHLWCG